VEPPARSVPARTRGRIEGRDPAARRRFAGVVPVAALVAILAGCGLVPGASASPRDAALKALPAQRAIWASHAIDDYQLTLVQQCFCPNTDPLVVTVRDGIATGVTSNGIAVAPALIANVPKTVPELFDIVAENADAADMVVAWDALLGFPTSISIDRIENAIDDEVGYTVTDFQRAS
jgi:hypothetical protein